MATTAVQEIVLARMSQVNSSEIKDTTTVQKSLVSTYALTGVNPNRRTFNNS